MWWKASLLLDCRQITPECGQCVGGKCTRCVPGFSLKSSKCEGMHESILKYKTHWSFYGIQKASYTHSLRHCQRVNFYETPLTLMRCVSCRVFTQSASHLQMGFETVNYVFLSLFEAKSKCKLQIDWSGNLINLTNLTI